LRVYRDTPFSPPIGVGFVDAQADYFIDPTVKPRKGYHYFMVAEDLAGQVSAPSNTTRTPTSGFSANFGLLRDWIGRYLPPQGFVAESQAAVSETRQGGGVSNQDDAPRAPVPVAGDEADQAVEISDLTITSTVSWWVYDSAWVGPNLSVEAPGQLELTAGSAITLTDGVGFGEGARGDLRIEPVDIPALQAGLRDSLFAELDRIEAQIRGGEFAIGLMSLQILRKNLLRMGEDGVLPLWQAQDLEILTDKVMRRVLLTEEGFLTLEDLFPLIPSG
jgi:hypothetical protein